MIKITDGFCWPSEDLIMTHIYCVIIFLYLQKIFIIILSQTIKSTSETVKSTKSCAKHKIYDKEWRKVNNILGDHNVI